MRGVSNQTSAPTSSVIEITDIGPLTIGSTTITETAVTATAVTATTVTATAVTASANVNAATLTTTGNVWIADRAFVTSASTAGNSGVQFLASAYEGPLVEKRLAVADRWGLGVRGGNTRVYAGTASAASRVGLGYMLGETAFLEGLTVSRDGTSTATANVGINNTAPIAALHVTGNVRVEGAILATQDITAFSDASLKTDLRVIDGALARVGGLTGYTYARVDVEGGPRHAGLIAQDVRRVLPEAVHATHNGTLALAQAGVAALLVEAVKALETRVADLATRVADLATRVAGLESR